jgi:ribosomal protein S18 acetylase RimI-like enzyme
MSFDVARAQLADVEKVRAILEEAREWLVSKGIDQWPYPWTKDWLADKISQHDVYLAVENGSVIGTVTIQWSDRETWGEMPDDAGYIHHVTTHREHARRGLGLELLRWAERRIESCDKKYSRLDCWSENPKLCSYYEAAGYQYQRTVATRYGPVSLYQKELKAIVHIFEAKNLEHLHTARRLFEQYAQSLGFDLGFQDFAAELRNLPGEYAPPHGCILLAKQDEKIVGCVALRKLEETICEMKRLYVIPEARGHGTGRKLSETVILRAKEMGYKRMRLDSLSSMESANHLYSSLGFRPIAPYRYNPLEGAEFYELSL